MTDYKISQLTALSTPASGDLLVIVDTGDTSTSPAGAAGSDKKITAANLLQTVFPSGDATGVTDAANINTAVTALPAQGGTVRMAATARWYIECEQVVIARSGVYLDAEGCFISAVGTGDVFRMYDTVDNWVANGAYGGGILGQPVIDGTSAAAGSCGVHMGDLLQGACYADVQNFTGTGSIGVHFDNAHYWTEQLRGRIFASNCTQHVVFDVTGATTSSASFARADVQVYISQGTASYDGVVFQNGAVLYDGALAIRGNFASSSGSLTSCVLRITGTVPAGHPGAGNAAKIADSRLDIGVECASGANTPTTIIRGSGSNGITNCYGLLDFGGDESSANFTAAATIGILVPFMGTIKGDGTLGTGGQGFAQGAAWNASGGLSMGNFTAATVITSNGTIDTSIPLRRVSETGSVTGMILGAGSYDGQLLWVLNESGFTITFAASGTSHVADGVSDVIPALCARAYIFDGNDTNLWYRCG